MISGNLDSTTKAELEEVKKRRQPCPETSGEKENLAVEGRKSVLMLRHPRVVFLTKGVPPLLLIKPMGCQSPHVITSAL